jgi:hypothetical protein
MLDQAEKDHVGGLIRDELAKRFPGAVFQDVAVLQYGDEPVVEPGELMVRVTLASGDDEAAREQTLHGFEEAHRAAIKKFREDLTAQLPEARRLEFRTAGSDRRGPVIFLGRGPRQLEARAGAGGDLTPVMARLGPADLETLDTLITAGIAPNRAEAVRWALAKIRERPAYEQLVARTREIEELKAQF